MRQDLVKAFPQSRDYHRELAGTYSIFAELPEKFGKQSEAMIHWKDCALQFGDSMLLANKDTMLMSAETRKNLQEEDGKNALIALNRSAKLGFKDVNFLRTAPEFQLLRGMAGVWAGCHSDGNNGGRQEGAEGLAFCWWLHMGWHATPITTRRPFLMQP